MQRQLGVNHKTARLWTPKVRKMRHEQGFLGDGVELSGLASHTPLANLELDVVADGCRGFPKDSKQRGRPHWGLPELQIAEMTGAISQNLP